MAPKPKAKSGKSAKGKATAGQKIKRTSVAEAKKNAGSTGNG